MKRTSSLRRRHARTQIAALSPAEARAWRRRWALVNAAEIKEMRGTPVWIKLRQLSAMMASARFFPKTAAEKAEEAGVRDRWNRLRRMRHA